MKTVNIEEILDKHLSLSSIMPPGRSFYLAAMREACIQTIEMASEQVEQYEKQSILDLKSQII